MTAGRSLFAAAISLMILAALFSTGCGKRERSSAAGFVAAVSDSPGAPVVDPRTGWITPAHYAGPLPKQPARLQPGQQFLCLPDSSPGMPDFTDSLTGQPIPAHSLGLRVLTLESVASPANNPDPSAPRTLTFAVEGSAGKLTLASGASVDNLAGLLPMADDDALGRFRRAYEGRFIWCYGSDSSLAVTDDSRYWASAETPRLLPMRVRRIVRVDLLGVPMAIGQPEDVTSDTIRQNAYSDDRPLVIVFDTPNAKCEPETGSDINIYGPFAPDTPTPIPQQAPPADLRAHVLGSYYVVADGWDLERRFSLKSPQVQHSEWSSRTLRRIAAGPSPGMTRDMVAWAWGFGNGYGTAAQLRRASSWTYDDLKPWFITISFNKRGRVSNIDMPTLP